MKFFTAIVLLLLFSGFSKAQQFPYWEVWNKAQADSLQVIWNNTTNDTLRMGISRSIGNYYAEIELDRALYYFRQELTLARKLNQKLWEADALDAVGYVLSNLNDYPASLQAFLSAIKIAEDEHSERNIWQVSRFSLLKNPTNARLAVLCFCNLDLGRLYSYTGNVKKQLSHRFEGLRIAQILNDPSILSNVYSNLGKDFTELNKLDSALMFLEKSIYYYDISGFKIYKGGTLSYIGLTYVKKGDFIKAKKYFTEAVWESKQVENLTDLSSTYLFISDLYNTLANRDSSLWYSYKGLEYARLTGSPGLFLNAYTRLASNFKSLNNTESAYYYQSLAVAIKDSINNIERINQFQNIGFNEQLREQELEKERIEYQNKIRTNTLTGGLFTLTIIAFLLYRNNRQKHKAKQNIEKAFSQLKSAQSQLIQSEKMASLGELTAGIAHEIQNPLNFVNNFSEVNKELLDEIQEERKKDKAERNEILESELISNVRENEEKINHHGKRADAIVKGMLAHSRSGSGQKEPTDINALCDEYLRLAYHGLKARDKNFEASFHFEPDPTLTKINVVPQDIGRVLLNLINNAFQACTERSLGGVNERKNGEREKGEMEKSSFLPSSLPPFLPQVTLTTRNLNDKIEISIRDNGPGIPEAIRDKIFQPFFTTKPSGLGTGLGLSLSYDIIKAHGGEMKVKTEYGEGAEFIITLSIN